MRNASIRVSKSRVLVMACLTLLVASSLAGCGPSPNRPRRLEVPKAFLRADDGDSFGIVWPRGTEEVRILGIDAPEIRHVEHDIPYDQPLGREAAGFWRGCIAGAVRVSLLRSGQTDPYGRTLAYLYVDGRNYSALLVEAGLAVETVSHYGDNGLAAPAAEVVAAAARTPEPPFEPPHLYRRRMRTLSERLQADGRYPPPLPEAPEGADSR